MRDRSLEVARPGRDAIMAGGLGRGFAAGLTGAACGAAYAAGVLCRCLSGDLAGRGPRRLARWALGGLLGAGRAGHVAVGAAVGAGLALGRARRREPGVVGARTRRRS